MKRRAGDATPGPAIGALACPGCGRPLAFVGNDLECPQGHRFPALDGYYDLWPPGRPAPPVDWFATPYGKVYDAVIKERWLARVGGRVGWGTDIDRMYRMMDEGVRAGAGQVVLDVPVGGAPPLRTAPGRLLGTYIGIDLSDAMLRRAARERADAGLENVVLARGDATSLPLVDRAVDRILCFNGLHVLPDKLTALQEFHRVLKPGGEIFGNVVILDRDPLARVRRPWFSRPWLFFHPADADELAALAQDAGFAEWDQDPEGAMLYFRGRRSRD